MNQNELKNIAKFVLDNLESSRNAINHAYLIKDYLIDLTVSESITEQEFYKISSLLTPQSRSSKWQNYFIKKNGCRKVPSSADRGDFEKNGIYYEFKASGFNRENCLHIVQIRLWQNCHYVIQSISDQGAITFVLSHDQMANEVQILKAARAHGTASAVAQNVNVELRMTLKIGSDHWNRWLNQYRITKFVTI